MKILGCDLHAKQQTIAMVDSLRWKHERRASHRGGTRDVRVLCRELTLTSTPLRGTVVLVDDVVTTGSHLLAAAAKLATAGVACFQAICLGRALSSAQGYAFSVTESTFPMILRSLQLPGL